MSAVIEINNLTKKYGDKNVIDDLSIAFEGGKVTGLLGPNGAGKSTLLKMLMGLVKPESGNIKIFGEQPSVKLNSQISYLPDRAGWYLFQTVKQSIAYANVIFPRFNMEKAYEMLGQMKLDLDIRIGNMSKGQQACLYLIFCLARETKLCLLDEPFSGIDLISRERIIQSIIDSIIDNKQTIILSTHEIHESESLFENVVFLDNGHIKLSSEVEELRKQGDSLESVYRRLYI